MEGGNIEFVVEPYTFVVEKSDWLRETEQSRVLTGHATTHGCLN